MGIPTGPALLYTLASDAHPAWGGPAQQGFQGGEREHRTGLEHRLGFHSTAQVHGRSGDSDVDTSSSPGFGACRFFPDAVAGGLTDPPARHTVRACPSERVSVL